MMDFVGSVLNVDRLTAEQELRLEITRQVVGHGLHNFYGSIEAAVEKLTALVLGTAKEAAPAKEPEAEPISVEEIQALIDKRNNAIHHMTEIDKRLADAGIKLRKVPGGTYWERSDASSPDVPA